MTDPEDGEPTLVWTRAAATAARAANHAAYNAPAGDVGNLYARTGAAYELLMSTEQVLRGLARQVDRLRNDQGLLSTDDTAPQVHAEIAGGKLGAAASVVNQAITLVNDAWSELSPIGRLPDEDGGVGR